MKCAAKAVIQNERYNFQQKKYGELFLDWSETAFVYYAAKAWKAFRDGVFINRMLYEVTGRMVDEVTGAVPDKLRLREGGRRWWGSEAERTDDAIRDRIYRWKMDWAARGLDPAMLMQLEPDLSLLGTAEKGSGAAEARASRMEYLEVRGRDAIQLWTLGAFLWVAEQEYSTGRARFNTAKLHELVYAPYAAEIRAFLVRFLSGSKEGYAKNTARLYDMRRHMIRAYGIDMTPPEDEPEEKPGPDPAVLALFPGTETKFSYSRVAIRRKET